MQCVAREMIINLRENRYILRKQLTSAQYYRYIMFLKDTLFTAGFCRNKHLPKTCKKYAFTYEIITSTVESMQFVL